jgi:hypothetical protein
MDGKNELIFVASIFPQISRLDLSTLDCAYAEDAEGGIPGARDCNGGQLSARHF